MTILKLMPVVGFKKVGTGASEDWKNSVMLKKTQIFHYLLLSQVQQAIYKNYPGAQSPSRAQT